MGKDRSAEMVRQRSECAFGAPLSFPSGNMGVSKEEVSACFRVWDIVAIQCGKWTKEEVLLLLKNKRNAICPKGDESTALHCPIERRDELFQILQILQEEFGRIVFCEDSAGRPLIIIGNKEKRHAVCMDYDGSCTLLMHCE